MQQCLGKERTQNTARCLDTLYLDDHCVSAAVCTYRRSIVKLTQTVFLLGHGSSRWRTKLVKCPCDATGEVRRSEDRLLYFATITALQGGCLLGWGLSWVPQSQSTDIVESHGYLLNVHMFFFPKFTYFRYDIFTNYSWAYLLDIYTLSLSPDSVDDGLGLVVPLMSCHPRSRPRPGPRPGPAHQPLRGAGARVCLQQVGLGLGIQVCNCKLYPLHFRLIRQI